MAAAPLTDRNTPPTRMLHSEHHLSGRIGWLRAAVMGANDGIVSTASLVVGVAAAGASRSAVLVSGIAGLVAGAMSMAAGEYVSVSSQSDTETADLARERAELADDDEVEHAELAAIYVDRGLEPALARQVAEQLMVWIAPPSLLCVLVVAVSVACLALLGALAARAGGARAAVGAMRVAFWGALAMAITYGVGALFGAAA